MGEKFVFADLDVNDAHKRDVKLSYLVRCEEKKTEAQAIKV